MKLKTAILMLLLMGSLVFAQEKELVNGIFRGSRIINSHSLETQRAGEFEFILSHRFGTIENGISDLFGLDVARMRMGFAYGATSWLTLGVGRSTFEKTYDGYVKARILRQKKGGLPFSMTYLGSTAIRTQAFGPQDSIAASKFTNRLFYTHQIMIGSKISDRLSIQIMPTLVHRNFIDSREEETNDVFAIGGAMRFRLTKTLALSGEYYYVLPGQLRDGFVNSAAIGIEISTNGHDFQIELTNSQGMQEKIFITETTSRWSDMGIRMGFNLSRKFKARGKWF
ncbi:MAG: DUF5777 family beta-barrel protein [Bacteroidota bacterium]